MSPAVDKESGAPPCPGTMVVLVVDAQDVSVAGTQMAVTVEVCRLSPADFDYFKCKAPAHHEP